MEPYEVQLASADGTVTLTLIGDIDLAAEQLVRSKIDETLSLGPATILLDMSQCTFLDSAGVSALVTLSNQAADRSCSVSLRPGPPSVMRILDITGLGDLFEKL